MAVIIDVVRTQSLDREPHTDTHVLQVQRGESQLRQQALFQSYTPHTRRNTAQASASSQVSQFNVDSVQLNTRVNVAKFVIYELIQFSYKAAQQYHLSVEDLLSSSFVFCKKKDTLLQSVQYSDSLNADYILCTSVCTYKNTLWRGGL